ncbi:MAG TPA: MFS transporter, partial [Ktedonobacteraceae bacterium]|nr:MFS transporter [Ktedonobacteraceae bacterium]
AFSVILALFAISQSYALSLLLIAGVGFAQIAFSATSNTTLQTVTPNHLRGRVMSVYMLVFAGSTPLGNLFTGGLAHWFGAPGALLIDASLCIIAAIVAWIIRKPAERSLAESTRLAD